MIRTMTNKRLKPLISTMKLIPIALSVSFLTSCSHMNLAIDEDNTEQVGGMQENITPTLDSTITLEKVTLDVAYLSSDELKGRDNFSTEIHIAADYIAKRFTEVGLIPDSTAPNFKQQYTVQKIKPGALNVEINGQVIDKDALAMVTTVTDIQWSKTSNQANQANQANQNDKKSPYLKDLLVNTVIIGENDNMRKSLRKLNHQGGQHLVLLHPKHEKSFKRYQSYFANGLTTLVNKLESKQGGVIVIALTNIDKVKQYTVKGNAEVSNTTLSNVIGVLPGKSKANEIVLYSAHYDHLGVKPTNDEKLSNTEPKGSNIFNGADDDASGVSAIINLANHFAKMANNERTLMFSAFSAEELGGFGSRHFSAQIDPNQITAMINIEMIGKPATFGEGSVWMTGMERSNLGEQLNQVLATQDLNIYADPYPKEKLFYRSDNATLARLGVPAHSFSSTQLDKDQHYHQVTDDINSLNIPSMLQVIKTLAIATTPLVDGSITPSRIDPNKVKRQGLIY